MPGFKTIALILCICIETIYCSAQPGIAGFIVDGNNRPVAHASVQLLHSKDSSLVKGVFSEGDGSFIFQNIRGGVYRVIVSAAGFKSTYSPSFDLEDEGGINLGNLVLTDSIAQLKEVTVTAKKPLYEHRPDRLIVNVQSSVASAGSTALDVLERSPGVVVNRQSASIAMDGKDGVVMMINGKITHIPGDAIIGMLEGMSSGNIEKIELITTPPASLDAGGNAGYINIILKTNNNLGINGSYSATLGYGKGLVDEASFNFNYRKGKINVYGNLSYTRLKKPLPIDLHTRLPSNGDTIENNFTGHRVEANRNIIPRIGIDYQLSKKTVLGILLSGYASKYTHSETNENLILKNSHTDTTVKQANSELKTWHNISANFNVQHDFDDGNRLSANVDYIYYINKQPYDYFAAFYNSAGDFAYDQRSRSDKTTPIWFWIGALDYTKKLGRKLVMETGFKRTIAYFSNDLGVQHYSGGLWSADSSLSANHTLNENYTALYASAAFTINDHTHGKAGLRYEYTNYDLETTGKKDISARHYGNLFPVVTLSHKFNEHSSLDLSYNRRISRPTFNELAPYTYFITENTLITGNPSLQPSISNSVTAAVTWRKYVFSLSASSEDHAIAGFQPTIDPVPGKVLISSLNLASQKLLSARLSIPVEAAGWWSMQYNIAGVWQQVNGPVDNPTRMERYNFNINVIESLRLPKEISVELSGFYQSGSLSGISRQKGFGSLDAGIKKKLAGRKGAFTFSAGNILNSQDLILTTGYPEQNEAVRQHIQFTQPTFKLTYSRSFGNDKLKERREHSTGAEDERGRVQ